MDENSLSYKTLKNLSYSFIAFGFPILFSVFITPVVVHRLGIVDYGIYILTNTITGFVGLLDLGVSASMVKYFSEFHAQDNFPAMQRLIKSLGGVYILMGLVGLAVFLVLGAFFLPAFHITGLSQGNIFTVFTIAGLVFFVNSANSVYINVPQALQRYDLVTKINLSQLLVLNVGTLIAVLLGYKLKVIMLINLLAALGLTLAYKIVTNRLLPKLRMGISWDLAEVRKIYSYGFFAALTTISNGALNQLDRLIIPIFMGPAALSYYSLPGNVSQKTTTIVGSVSSVFFPMASSIAAKGQMDRLAEVYKKIVRNLSVLGAAMAISIALFGYQILFYWLGKDFADHGWFVLIISAGTYYLLALFSTLINILMGIGKVRFLACWSFVLAVINVIAMFVLVPPFGIVGAAWAFLIGTLPIVWMFYKAERDFFKLSGIFSFYIKLYAKILFTGLIFALLVKLLIIKAVTSFLTLIILGPASVILYLALYKLFGFFETEDWALFSLFLKKILAKISP